MHGNLEVLAVRLFNDRRELRQRNVLSGRDFDDVNIPKHILSNGLSCLVWSIHQQEFLLEDGVG
jgi:hypothetical protein